MSDALAKSGVAKSGPGRGANVGGFSLGEHVAQVTLNVYWSETRGLTVTTSAQLGARAARLVLTGEAAARAARAKTVLERAAAAWAVEVGDLTAPRGR